MSLIEDALEKYSKELGLIDTMDINSFIESHRRLREENIRNLSDRKAAWNEARKAGEKYGYDSVTTGDYIKVEDLKKMTILEFANRFYEGGEY